MRPSPSRAIRRRFIFDVPFSVCNVHGDVMPLRELKYPDQIESWLRTWGAALSSPGEMILIGSGALLWHAFQLGTEQPLPENSMDVDPITENEEIAILAYDAMIGSEFEKQHGWHVNLMPRDVLREFLPDWESRAQSATYGHLTVTVPSVSDLLVSKLKRAEPRDIKHAQWAKNLFSL